VVQWRGGGNLPTGEKSANRRVEICQPALNIPIGKYTTGENLLTGRLAQ
jgi:hypothetical protein